MTYIGVIGSENYKNKKFVIEKLIVFVKIENDIIVSGHSPANNYSNVDIWAEKWAKKNCWNKPVIFPPKSFNRKEFFIRNKEIALQVQKLLCFINRGEYRSGVWNTVSYFMHRPDFNYTNLIVFDELGMLWKTRKLPLWVQNKIFKTM